MSDTQLTTLQITYDDKVDINDQSSYQVNQLWTAEDANQVKNVVNQISTFYDLNLTSDGWKFNFVSTTDRASSISADTNTLQYVSSNSADSNKNINYSGNVLFYASVSAISQMVPNSSGSYDPQPFIATNPEHIATKAYVDGKIKSYQETIDIQITNRVQEGVNSTTWNAGIRTAYFNTNFDMTKFMSNGYINGGNQGFAVLNLYTNNSQINNGVVVIPINIWADNNSTGTTYPVLKFRLIGGDSSWISNNVTWPISAKLTYSYNASVVNS